MKHAITLEAIRAHGPCASGWAALLKSLGYSGGHYDPGRTVTLGDIAKSNGAADAFWCVRALPANAWTLVAEVLRRAVGRAESHAGKGAATWAAEAARAAEAAEAAEAAWAAWAWAAATWAAVEAAEAAWAAEAAEAAWAAAEAAEAAEREKQVADLIEVFGLSEDA